MNVLLDTNVISEMVARRPSQRVLEWVESLDVSTVYLSVLTIGEIRKGIERLPPSKRRESLGEWLASDLLLRFEGRIAPITVETMLTWGRLSARLEREGRPMGAIDSLIAATALAGDFILATRNTDDFSQTGVQVINPWE